MTNSLSFIIDKNGVANLTFDLKNQKVNKLDANTLMELEKAINVIDNNAAIRVLIINSDKKDIFIAGADIAEIKDITTEEEALKKVKRGQDILTKLANLKIPTIALVNGACLGGGLELALACKYRVAITNPKTVFALPEVNLGIIPGFGGTQRLPKLIGLQESLKMILSGKSIDCKKALKSGLVDLLIREEFLEDTLSEFVTLILNSEDGNQYLQTRKKSCKKRFIFESLLGGKFIIFSLAKKDLLEKTKGHYPAPLYALEVIKRTYPNCPNSQKAFDVELEAFCELVVGQISKNLIDIFFINEELKKENFISSDSHQTAIEIKNAAGLGAGIMGGGIAWLFSYHDINFRIKDITQNAVALGYNQVLKIYNQLKNIGKLTNWQINLKLSKITSSLDYKGFEDVDIAIEAIIENIDIKKKALAELETHLSDHAIIASNTSSLSITKMAETLKNPERFAGMHFFNPVNKMPLIEIIRGQKTNDQTILSLVKLSKTLGKTPIVVKDVAGFLVNRILLPYINEAAFLLQEGVEINRIDRLIEEFGMPMGPFYLSDVVGIDVGAKVAHSLFESYGERMKVAEILTEISTNHKDLTGKKSNQGFYLYQENQLIESKNKKINPKISEILNSLNKEPAEIISKITDQEIIDRCILIIVAEAARCLEENVVKNAHYLDMALIMGTGFPAFRGGILKYADNYGIKEILSKLQEFETKFGIRYKPCDLLIKMAKNNQKFYGNL